MENRFFKILLLLFAFVVFQILFTTTSYAFSLDEILDKVRFNQKKPSETLNLPGFEETFDKTKFELQLPQVSLSPFPSPKIETHEAPSIITSPIQFFSQPITFIQERLLKPVGNFLNKLLRKIVPSLMPTPKKEVTEKKILPALKEFLPQFEGKAPILVHLTKPTTKTEITKLENLGSEIKYQYKLIPVVALSIDKSLVERLVQLPFVKLIEPDSKTTALLAQSTKQIQADKVWAKFKDFGENVKVAILDTGIDNNHPDLQNIVLEKDFTGEGTNDENGHGTHVAGIAAGSGKTSAGLYQGVAPKTNLFDVKVLNKDGNGFMSDLIAGIEYAVYQKAQVINISLGAQIPCNGLDAASLAVDAAFNQGVLPVVAAGNSGPAPSTITAPGCAKNALTVGAVDKLDNLAYFSSRGPTLDGRTKPDLVAPGVLIIAPKNGGGYINKSGTSMATPHVSGTAALVLATNPNLSAKHLKSLLEETATNLNYEENSQGKGRIDAYKAVAGAKGVPSEKETPPEKKSEEKEKPEETVSPFPTPTSFEKEKEPVFRIQKEKMPKQQKFIGEIKKQAFSFWSLVKFILQRLHELIRAVFHFL